MYWSCFLKDPLWKHHNFRKCKIVLNTRNIFWYWFSLTSEKFATIHSILFSLDLLWEKFFQVWVTCFPSSWELKQCVEKRLDKFKPKCKLALPMKSLLDYSQFEEKKLFVWLFDLGFVHLVCSHGGLHSIPCSPSAPDYCS